MLVDQPIVATLLHGPTEKSLGSIPRTAASRDTVAWCAVPRRDRTIAPESAAQAAHGPRGPSRPKTGRYALRAGRRLDRLGHERGPEGSATAGFPRGALPPACRRNTPAAAAARTGTGHFHARRALLDAGLHRVWPG